LLTEERRRQLSQWGTVGQAAAFFIFRTGGEEPMVIITINGKKLEREFQNMAQALAFAYQNGECYGADVIEIKANKTKVEPKEQPNTETTNTTNENPKPLEEMTKDELTKLAKSLGIKVSVFSKPDEIITAIKAKEAADKKPEEISDAINTVETNPVVTDGSEPVEEAGVDNAAHNRRKADGRHRHGEQTPQRNR
jgi:hypothetical protein